MKKNKKGFTLIELLAVIVILGLLMAIAIPSVTRYITQSRKKTAVSTMGNYMSAMVSEVNDLEYTFTTTNTIYAVPIECISVERGGKSPFGEWMQANDAYWAYVLVQYDELASSYTYGFTFKDSAGYGMYPMVEAKIDTKGSQIQTGLNLTRPKNGLATNFIELNKWEGFSVDSNTNLVVLEASSEAGNGDGKTTCTLRQKGNNYAKVEEEKEKAKVAYALYLSDNSLIFVRSAEELKTGDVYDATNNITITKIFTNIETRTSQPWMSQGIDDKVKKVIFKDKIYPISTNGWFKNFKNCDYFDVTNLVTTNVTDMENMFMQAGYETSSFNIIGMENWDTSKVTTMKQMFNTAGMAAYSWSIGDISNWNVSNVKSMFAMFAGAAAWNGCGKISLGDLGKWNISKVTETERMFYNFGKKSSSFYIGDLSKWADKTSKLTNVSGMFGYTGQSSNWSIDCSKWNVSSVTDSNNFNIGVENKVKSPFN